MTNYSQSTTGLAMLKSAASCFVSLALLVLPYLAFGEEPQKQPQVEKTEKQPFTVLVVDPEGKPVADAQVGSVAHRNVESGEDWQFLPRTEMKQAVTDANGRTQMFVDDMPSGRANLAIIAWQASRKLVGVVTVSRAALLSASKDKSAITISLQPECRVHGHIQSTGLEKFGQRIGHSSATVEANGNRIFAHYCDSGELDFEFFLPPGTYSLTGWGGVNGHLLTALEPKSFTVPAATAEFELGVIDLPPSNMTKLIGQPAPEIADVVAWKNSEPLKLADLHGKYVLLEFFGHWCGPCVHAMPKVFELHDQYSRRGLIIIGVHVGLDNDSIDSAEKLDVALAESRKELWGGRDLPFPVAIVASERKKYFGAEQPAGSQASADYGVQAYPSQVLIDPAGKVVGRFNEKEHLKLFEALLKVE